MLKLETKWFVDKSNKIILPTNKNKDTIFIDKAIKKHGNKLVIKKLITLTHILMLQFTCSEHGNFQQRATNHLMGQGCPNALKLLVK
jgi:hypothetical protein